MKVLVTGGGGWIGRATCDELIGQGYEPVVFDRSNGFDVLDENAVFETVREVDHVIHLAGLLGTHELLDHVRGAVDVNVQGSLNVTLACVQHHKPLTEITMPRVNPSIYAATKAAAMDIALAYHDAGMLECSFVRAYNAYGPGQAYGGDHPQKIIPTFASKAWRGEPVPVWGDGKLLVDLVHVADVARMLVAAMHHGGGQVFDAGTGVPWTVTWVAKRVIELTGGRSRIKYLPRRACERQRSGRADYAWGEGWDLLGWEPKWDDATFAQSVESYKP